MTFLNLVINPFSIYIYIYIYIYFFHIYKNERLQIKRQIERLQKKARERYQNLSKEKENWRQYGGTRYKNLPENEKNYTG